MKTEDLATKILDIVGQSNITFFTHCATRLRFNVRDEASVDLKALDRLEGVIKAQFRNGQLQIIIGAKVKSVFDSVSEILVLEKNNIEVESVQQKKNPISRAVEAISGIFGPVIPVLIGCGMVKSFLVLLTTLKLVSTSSGAYQIFDLSAMLIFYFFPFFLAVSAAKKFKTSEYLAVALAGAYMYPTIMNGAAKAAETGITSLSFFGLPVLFVNYKSTIIPIIISVWVMSYVHRFFEKRIPDMLKIIFVPMLVLLTMIPLQLIAIGPFGTYVGRGIATVITYLYATNGVIGAFIFGTLRPILIIFGMHFAITPINGQLIAEYGYSVIGPANLTGNLAQGAACLGVFMLLKNKINKSNALSAGVTGIIGITEPSIFGFNLKYKKPFIVACLAGGIGAAYVNFWGGGATALVLPGIFALPTYIADSFIHIIIGVTISVVLAFVGTMIVGIGEEDIPESVDEDITLAANFVASAIDTSEKKSIVNISTVDTKEIMTASPLNGIAKDLSKVNDATFADKMLGDGVAIESEDGKVYAPFDGTVASVFPTNHAIALVSDDGVEMLIHIGLDTVNLNGKHFTAHVKQEQKVKQGDLLIEFDQEAIKAAGYDVIVPVVVTNTDTYQKVERVAANRVKKGEALLSIKS